MSMRWTVLLTVFLAAIAHAEVPDAQTLAREIGISDSDFASALAGNLVSSESKPSNPRELTAMLLFLVPGTTPTKLVKLGQGGLLDRVDPNTTRTGNLGASAGSGDFAKLSLAPDQATLWASAAPGDALNLSSAEIAKLSPLGSGAAPAAVEPIVRGILAERLQSYRARGLAGIAPYARADGGVRSAEDDLRSAVESLKAVQKYVPHAYQMLLQYPSAKPAGTEELFRWSQIQAHGVPTVILMHGLYVPDGDAWIVVQRHFYVSTGYNCEQAVAAFLPVTEGTMVFYGNRTSTDQVTGWGGGAKRSIGSRILESSLEDLFKKARATVAPTGE